MDKKIIIKPEKVTIETDLVATMEYMHFTYDTNKDPELIEFSNSAEQTISAATFYSTYPQGTIDAVDALMGSTDVDAKKKISKKNIFFFDYPVDETKFIGWIVTFIDGTVVVNNCKIVGYDEDTEKFELENFTNQCNIDTLFYEGDNLEDLL